MSNQEKTGCEFTAQVLGMSKEEGEALTDKQAKAFNEHLGACETCETAFVAVFDDRGDAFEALSSASIQLLARAHNQRPMSPHDKALAQMEQKMAVEDEAGFNAFLDHYPSLALAEWGLSECTWGQMLDALEVIFLLISRTHRRKAQENPLIFHHDGGITHDEGHYEPFTVLGEIKLMITGITDAQPILNWVMAGLELHPTLIRRFRAVPVEDGFRMEYGGIDKEKEESDRLHYLRF